MRKELILSENKLQEIPETLAGLKALRVLRLQNNRLKSLPHALGEVVTLEDLDCAGNADFDIVPVPLHSDTAMILWICRLHKGWYYCDRKIRYDTWYGGAHTT